MGFLVFFSLRSEASSLPLSGKAHQLALAKCHIADLKDVASTSAAELVVNQLVTIVPKRLEVLHPLRF